MSPGQLRRMIQPFERSIVAQTASFTIRPSLAWKEVEERFLEAARGPIAVASLLRRSDFELARSRRYQILLYLYATGQVHFKSPPLPQRHGASPPARLLRRTTKKRMTTVDPLVGGKKRFSREEVIALARKGSALEDADLSGLDLSGLDLSGAHLAGVNLHKANLRNTRLCRANLMRANLSGANLYNTDLSQANLSRAIFHQAHLVKTKLDGANLEKAVFEDLRTWLGH
ncbi:MAG: pentapeptide repeat-containing protein [Deltaproteobacteria bacterium]|nr:MAG: pentapeptide repeat-containing protein [Deltaproteobacteria bacterium]